ncbi:BppU family phage baseplate upper protein [Weissella paramesenteroides]
MSNQYLSFDVTKQSAPQQLITGRQGDSQLKFVSVLLWDGDKNIPYDLTGKQIAFEALKPDGTHIVDYAGMTILDASHGLFRYSFNEQVFAIAGKMQQAFFKITHTDKDGQVIADSTLEINIHILENRVEFGINSTDYLSEYEDLIAQVKQKFDDYAATVQDSIDKANALHDQIVAYTQLINDKQVLTLDEFNEKITPYGNPDSLDIHVDDGVTNTFKNPVDIFKATINTDDKVAKIALIQDLHFQRDIYPDEYGIAATKGLEQVQHIGRLQDALDVVVNNGDLVHGHELKDGTEKRIKQLVATEKCSSSNQRSCTPLAIMTIIIFISLVV